MTIRVLTADYSSQFYSLILLANLIKSNQTYNEYISGDITTKYHLYELIRLIWHFFSLIGFNLNHDISQPVS